MIVPFCHQETPCLVQNKLFINCLSFANDLNFSTSFNYAGSRSCVGLPLIFTFIAPLLQAVTKCKSQGQFLHQNPASTSKFRPRRWREIGEHKGTMEQWWPEQWFQRPTAVPPTARFSSMRGGGWGLMTKEIWRKTMSEFCRCLQGAAPICEEQHGRKHKGAWCQH